MSEIKAPDYTSIYTCPICNRATTGGISKGKPLIYGNHKDCQFIAQYIRYIKTRCRTIDLEFTYIISPPIQMSSQILGPVEDKIVSSFQNK